MTTHNSLADSPISVLTFCFSAVHFFIYPCFRAVVSALWAFLSSRHSSAVYCFYCIVSLLMNKIFNHIVSYRLCPFPFIYCVSIIVYFSLSFVVFCYLSVVFMDHAA